MLSDSVAYSKKLRGWLSYAFARRVTSMSFEVPLPDPFCSPFNSEVFVIVSLTLFLPICLEQFARDNGFLLPDRTERCSAIAKLEAGTTRCVVKIAWIWMDSASFSLYVYSISVALQALTVISMGGIADHQLIQPRSTAPHRKRLLLSFALLGATPAIIFLVLPSTSPLWILAAPLAIFANVGFGASIVAMNAYLPTLAKESPEVFDRLRAKYEAELSRVTSRISSFGIALGYGAGIFLLIIALIPVTLLQGSTFALRLAIGLSGVWWAVFTIPAAIWLPGSGVVELSDPSPGQWSMKREVFAAWKRLGNMLRWTEIKKLRNTFKYLSAWFLLSDGFTTITSTAILFGKTSLNMRPSALILVGVLTPTSGILGSLAWPYIQRRYGWSNLKVIIILVLMASVIPAYGCLGFLSIFQGKSTRFGGLTTQGEMFALAVYFGSVYGAFQGYARAFFAELLPPGEEARWYGLFSITDKSSSFIGPLIVGLIADTTGNIRYAFFFLVIMVWMALPILIRVDVERGRKDAREYHYTAA
ncbi:Autophagy-related protein 22-2 [Termitomyces sp. J132]|nr:Autophagy-related protein 22-2 [Termitomyces sp. J132]